MTHADGHDAAKKIEILVTLDVPQVLHRGAVRHQRILVVVGDRRPNEFLVLTHHFVAACRSNLWRSRHPVSPFSKSRSPQIITVKTAPSFSIRSDDIPVSAGRNS